MEISSEVLDFFLCSYFHSFVGANPFPIIWSSFAATSVGPTEVLAFFFWAYKVFGIMVVLRGICDPGQVLSVEVDIWLLGVVVV